MNTDSSMQADFRMPTASKWRAPRAVVDSSGGNGEFAEIEASRKLVMTRKFDEEQIGAYVLYVCSEKPLG